MKLLFGVIVAFILVISCNRYEKVESIEYIIQIEGGFMNDGIIPLFENGKLVGVTEGVERDKDKYYINWPSNPERRLPTDSKLYLGATDTLGNFAIKIIRGLEKRSFKKYDTIRASYSDTSFFRLKVEPIEGVGLDDFDSTIIEFLLKLKKDTVLK